ncbi:MAG: hypothetical protein ACRELC_01375, partial [Gemmatimonadota bacterium]
QEAGWFPILEADAYDVSSSLSDEEGLGAILRGLVSYHAEATWLEVVGWLAYLVVAGAVYLRRFVVPPVNPRSEHREWAVSSSTSEPR